MRTVQQLERDNVYLHLFGKWLYKINQQEPYLEYCRPLENNKHFTRPNDYRPWELYLHPYFPEKEILAIEVLANLPFCFPGLVVCMQKKNGANFAIIKQKRLALTPADVYYYPNYFKPIYDFEYERYRHKL